MGEKIVVALGGNAILSKDATAQAQQHALVNTAKELIKFVENGDTLAISHGNGPQVGNLLLQQQKADSKENPAMPLDTCVAMTEGSIGYWLQNAMLNELNNKNIQKDVVTLITQIKVSEDDPAFKNLTKPIGPFLTEEQAKLKQQENPNQVYVEDAGRGYRRVVASPKPIDIYEKNVINNLLNQGVITISAGGGGISVCETKDGINGVESVIDKDFASAKLADLIDANTLIILTAVDNVYINYNQPNEQKLEKITISELEKYIQEGQFAKGSMLPKVQSAIDFVKNHPQRKAAITSLDKVGDFIKSGTGTIITN